MRIGRALIVTGAVLLAACGDGGPDEDTYDAVGSAALRPGDVVPAPRGPVVLTVTGNLGTTNVGESLQFDLELLESLQLVEYDAPDPLRGGEEVGFRGVLLTDVIDLADIDDVTVLHAGATGGYTVDIPADDLDHAVMVATSANGERLDPDADGPLRIVYPYLTDDLDRAEHDPRWIRQLVTIAVE